MNKDLKGRSFILIMVVIAVCALILRVGIEKLVKISSAQNESYAQSTLKLIATALENYAYSNKGVYPNNFTLLTKSKPAYLDKDYVVQSPLKGYNYSCVRLEASGYSCSATPQKCGLSATKIYTVTTGNLLVSEECQKKE